VCQVGYLQELNWDAQSTKHKIMPKCIILKTECGKFSDNLWPAVQNDCFTMNCFHRTCSQCQEHYSTSNLPLQTRFWSCLINGSCQKAQVFINIGHPKRSKFSYFFSERYHLIFNSLPQFCTPISGTLIFCRWFTAIHITVTLFEPWHFDPHATHIYCNWTTAFLHQPPVSYITFFFTLWGGGCTIPNYVSLWTAVHKLLNPMYQFLTPSHRFLLLFFLNCVYQQKYFWATQDFSPIYCSTNIEGDESYYPSWHTTFCTICPRLFSFTIYYSGENCPTQFQALSVSHTLQIIFLGWFLPQEAYLLFFSNRSQKTRWD